MKSLTGLVILGAVLFPSLASGEVTVTVLGLRSATADEQIAAQMTSALRGAADAAQSSGLSHSGRENQLSQLLVVFDCEDATTRCMREIGRSLSSQRLIYGLIEPDSGRSDADYAVTLRFFNVESGEVERDLRERVPRGTNPQGLAELANRFLMALTGTPVQGALAVTCNVEGAQILLGDREVGTTSAEPLMLDNLEAGEVVLEVRHEDYTAFRQTVTIEAGETHAMDVELTEVDGRSAGGTGDGVDGREGWVEPGPTEERRSLAWLGWTLVGTSAVFAGLGLWGSIHVNNAKNDEQLQYNYPNDEMVCGRGVDPVASDNGYTVAQATDKCSTARTLWTLQWVFYPLAAVTFGVGLWLAIREMRQGSSQDARRLEIIPIAFQGGGAISASLSF